MTTFTSSSVRRRALLALVALGGIAGCGPSGGAPAEARDQSAGNRPVRPGPSAAAKPSTSRPDVATLYTDDLARAVAGAKKMPFTGSGEFGGMSCSPGKISGASAASRALTLTLPSKPADRAHVLAVVTPERGLLEVYSPYGDAVEPEDLVIPSQAISWAKARGQNRFVTGTDQLDGLRPGADKPEALFIEPGRYRFALVNGIDAALLKANGAKVRVSAACSFDWTP